MSLYIVWLLVREGRTVVYEIRQKDAVYVIPSTGPIRFLSVHASEANVPELTEANAIHVFDAKADSRLEPAESCAFLVEFTSKNSGNYAQTIRRHGMGIYCVPSYEVEELLLFCELFGVTPAQVKQRCAEIGPSVRYILVNDFEECKARTIAVAKKIKAEQMDTYISNTLFGDGDDISACLVLAIVHENKFEDPDDAYKESNITWELASTFLAKIILSGASSNATTFVRNLITVVNTQGLTRMKGLVGNYFEIVVGEFLSKGCFMKTRRLLEARRGPFDATFNTIYGWQNPLQIVESNITDVETALRDCTDMTALYSFCKTFPAIDFASNNFVINFQVTNSSDHTINLEAIRAICQHVRTQHGLDRKLYLMFVVPEEIVTSGMNWRYAQSFSYLESFCFGTESRRRKRQCKYHELPEEIQIELKNLEQRVICYM